MALTLAVLCAAAPACAAQVLSPAAQLEVRRLEQVAAQFGRQTVNPAFCLQLKQKAEQWRERAATLVSPWRENLLASADKLEGNSGQCQQRSAVSKADAAYSLAQAGRIKNHQPLLLPQRSASVSAKYNQARKNLREIVAVLDDTIQRMAAATPRLERLVGKSIPSGGDPRTISPQDIHDAMGALASVRFALESVQESYERMNFQFADKFSTDGYLDKTAFDISPEYTEALNAGEYEWVMLANEIAWQLDIEQVEANAWADREAKAALIEKEAGDKPRDAGLSAALNNPGKAAVLGNRTGSEALLKFEKAVQPGIESYCARYQKAAADEAVALAAKVQAAADVLTQRRKILMQVRSRLGTDLTTAASLNRNGQTPFDYPDFEFSSAWRTPWPNGLSFRVPVPGYGHPGDYHFGSRIGFVECTDWRDTMPKDIAIRFPAVTPDYRVTASLNVNLVHPLVLEGEAEGRAPGQQL